MAPAELMLTRLPPPCSSKCGIAAAHVFHTPMRFDVDHRAPLIECCSVPRRRRQHAGVGHRSVQTAQLADAVIDGRAQLFVVADVDDAAHAATAKLRHQSYGLGEVVLGGQGIVDLRQGLADVDQDEIGSFLREPQRMAAAQTAGRAGDEYAFPGNAPRR